MKKSINEPPAPENPTPADVEAWEGYSEAAFIADGTLEKAKTWAQKNPPPKGWKYGPLAWAYLEAILFPEGNSLIQD